MAITLSKYRETIRVAWLKEMGRTRLKSAEYAHIKYWFEHGISVGLVLRAIERCVKRSRASGRSIWTIGVIQADINALCAQAARMWVGARPQERGQRTNEPQGDWREEWREDLEAMAESATNPEISAMYKELRVDLVALDWEQFEKRMKEIR